MRGLLNIDRGFFPAKNYMNFPELDAVTEKIDVETWVSFANRGKAKVFADTGLHFYSDDYTFESLWNCPAKYVEQLSRFGFIVQPDFSLYYNFPIALQIYNKFRNHWLARYLAHYGCKVIPNINPSHPDCWRWSFDGFPKHSIVAFSDIGSYRDRFDRALLQAGFEETLYRLEPLQVLYFCRNSDNVPDGCTPIVIDYKGD